MSTPGPEPVVTMRTAQPYVAVRRRVTMQTMDQIADRIPDVYGGLAERGIRPAGPPFLRYLVIDMERELEVEAGVPVDGPGEVEGVVPVDGPGEGHAPVLGEETGDGEGAFIVGVLPAGRYVTATHVGHPDGLVQATADLLAWAARQGLTWDMEPTSEGDRWGCRVEHYLTDPGEEPDMDRWSTELAFRLADDDLPREEAPQQQDSRSSQ